MIQCTVKGDFKKSNGFLKRLLKLDFNTLLKRYAEEGVEALASATPIRTGLTAASWNYEIVKDRHSVSIFWTNSNLENGVPIAVILDFGHGTGIGTYVQGRHYISPAIRPVFDKIADAAWKEVIRNAR